MQEKYKIGDIVRVKRCLRADTYYYYAGSSDAYLFFNRHMQKFCGNVYKIIDKFPSRYYGYVNYKLALGNEASEWVFSDVMLEPVKCLGGLICKRKKN